MVAKAPTVFRKTCSLENGEAKPGRLLSWSGTLESQRATAAAQISLEWESK
eukprot:00045_5